MGKEEEEGAEGAGPAGAVVRGSAAVQSVVLADSVHGGGVATAAVVASVTGVRAVV